MLCPLFPPRGEEREAFEKYSILSKFKEGENFNPVN